MRTAASRLAMYCVALLSLLAVASVGAATGTKSVGVSWLLYQNAPLLLLPGSYPRVNEFTVEPLRSFTDPFVPQYDHGLFAG